MKVSINAQKEVLYAPRRQTRRKVARKPAGLRSRHSLKMESARLAESEARVMAETIRHSEQLEEAMWASLEAFNLLED